MFVVRWVTSALSDLTEFWTDADSSERRDINSAVRMLDRRLSRDPDRYGESREEGRRIAFEPPLAVIFRIDAENEQVLVLHVWQIHRRS